MSKTATRICTYFLIFLMTVGVICSCCSCDVFKDNNISAADNIGYSTKSENSEDSTEPVSRLDIKRAVDTATSMSAYSTYGAYRSVCDEYSKWLDAEYSGNVITRVDWLKMLFDKLEIEINYNLSDKYYYVEDSDLFSDSDMFMTAAENGIIGKRARAFDPYRAVTRQYAALTLVNAVGYTEMYKSEIADMELIQDKKEVSTCVYLGYLKLDDDLNFNPYAPLTASEVDSILKELDYLKAFKGKKVLSFGDSIMHGDGNGYVGIADLLGQKYMMEVSDYSLGGATFGYTKGRQQISNQVLNAVANNETADIILLDGGTNDMRKCKPGKVTDSFEYGKHGREDFSSGMEYALGLIKDNFHGVKTLYIRAHDMKFSPELNEIYYGNMALDICDKWGVDYLDMYNDSDFDADDKEIRDEYTFYMKKLHCGDTIHPNREGYFEFYIPLIAEKMTDLNI